MKVILNKDLSTLGEEGDVKDVAKGYARNYLFPRGIALPYTPKTVKLFEARKGEIDARKEAKRQDARSLKEKLEALELSITMPAGANGKLYGAVTGQTISDELARQGFQIERKRIELAGSGFKSVGKYKALVKLYESASAEIQLTIIGQEIKTESRPAPARPGRRRRDEAPSGEARPEVSSPNAAGSPDAAAVPGSGAGESGPEVSSADGAGAPDTAAPGSGAGESGPEASPDGTGSSGGAGE